VGDTHVVLVEGKDDEHTLYALLNHHGVPRIYRVKDKNGFTNILATIDVELEASDLETLSIIIDADEDQSARWQAIRDRLVRSGFTNVPISPRATGTIVNEPDRPTVGIWLMPDNNSNGMLEDFIEFLVPATDTHWAHAVNSVNGIPPPLAFPPQARSKACLHTWLAWQNEPGKPIGIAITARYLDADASHAVALVAWQKRVFNI
jgi:hypothetical protein